MKKPIRIGLLWRVVIAIALGIVCSLFFPDGITRIFVTFNSIFSNYLGFAIPLIILGLVAPGIADLGNAAGKLLGITTLVAYSSTVVAGYFAYFGCILTFPFLLPGGGRNMAAGAEAAPDAAAASLLEVGGKTLDPFFTIGIPPLMDVVSALVLAFTLGLAVTAVKGNVLRDGLREFGSVINMVIAKTIVPLLPIFIFGIFLKMGAEGKTASIMGLFMKVIVLIFVMHILLLLLQYGVAGMIAKCNPFPKLKTMLPAYATALGTQSSAATIPVSLAQTIKMGVNPDLAGFVVPLCATIHLSGSILKIVACAAAIMWMTPGTLPISFELYTGFIFMLGIMMVAAPGVPGGAIMAALAVLHSILGFDAELQGLMIALYIVMDSFGTAGNVTGGGAIALIMDKVYRNMKDKEGAKAVA